MREKGSEMGNASRQYATFYLGELFFGVEVCQVQEVLRHQEMTCVPLAPDVVEGLINLRGQIVTAVDMRQKFGLNRRPAGKAPMNMVVRTDDGAASLLVDEIGDVIEAPEDSFELPPDNIPPGRRELIDGVYKLQHGLLMVLNTERALAVARTD